MMQQQAAAAAAAQQQRVISPGSGQIQMQVQMQPNVVGTRIIPIQIEGNGYNRGPISQAPTVMQK